jgi:hypothetical protein
VESIDSLQTLSELSMALVGFAGIVTAIKGVGQTLSGIRQIQMSMLFGLGMAGIVFAVLPQMLYSAQVEGQTIWRDSSAALLLTISVVLVIRIHQIKKANASIFDVGYTFHIPFNLQLCAAAANVYVASMPLYLFSLLCMLINGLFLFAILLRPENCEA